MTTSACDRRRACSTAVPSHAFTMATVAPMSTSCCVFALSLTFVVCTAGWNPSICSSSSSPGELVRLASAGGNEVPKTPLRAESEER